MLVLFGGTRLSLLTLQNRPNAFFISNTFFNSASLMLNFFMNWASNLLRFCLIHITVIVLRHILYLVYLCSCLGPGLFKSHLYFIFTLMFSVINYVTSFKQTYLFFVHFWNKSHYFWMITWMRKANNFQTVKVQPQGVA